MIRTEPDESDVTESDSTASSEGVSDEVQKILTRSETLRTELEAQRKKRLLAWEKRQNEWEEKRKKEERILAEEKLAVAREKERIETEREVAEIVARRKAREEAERKEKEEWDKHDAMIRREKARHEQAELIARNIKAAAARDKEKRDSKKAQFAYSNQDARSAQYAQPRNPVTSWKLSDTMTSTPSEQTIKSIFPTLNLFSSTNSPAKRLPETTANNHRKSRFASHPLSTPNSLTPSHATTVKRVAPRPTSASWR